MDFIMKGVIDRPCGAMDNASAYGAEDSKFDPWQTRKSLALLC